jgi:hypothetical protein
MLAREKLRPQTIRRAISARGELLNGAVYFVVAHLGSTSPVLLLERPRSRILKAKKALLSIPILGQVCRHEQPMPRLSGY